MFELKQICEESTLTERLLSKFKIDDKGNYYNLRLEEEVLKRSKYNQSRRKNLHMDTHMDGHMGNVNGNANENGNKDKKNNKPKKKRFTPPSLEQVKEYCKERKSHIDPETFWNTYESSDWIKANGLPVKNWKATLVTWEKRNPAPKPAQDARKMSADPHCEACHGTGEVFAQGTSKNVPCWCLKEK